MCICGTEKLTKIILPKIAKEKAKQFISTYTLPQTSTLPITIHTTTKQFSPHIWTTLTFLLNPFATLTPTTVSTTNETIDANDAGGSIETKEMKDVHSNDAVLKVGTRTEMMQGYFGDDFSSFDTLPGSNNWNRHLGNLYNNLLEADALFLDMCRDDEDLSITTLRHTGCCDECLNIVLRGAQCTKA